MKQKFLIIALCLSSMLFFTFNGWTQEQECCCQMTCNYVRVLGGSPTTIDVDQCWDLDKISACDEDVACLKVKNVFLTYTNEWTGSGCNVQEKCLFSLIYGADNPQLDTLRAFRDEVLSQTPEGQELIEFYYEWSPVLIQAMEKDEEFKKYVKKMIYGILPMMMEEEEE